MKTVDEWISTLEIDDTLLIQFFVIFSRYEYALKRTFHCEEPKWDRFTKEIKGKFSTSTSESLHCAIKYLKEHPPLLPPNWIARSYPKKIYDEKRVFDAIRDIRNTLFHGGKYPFRPVEEPARNQLLMRSCIEVLWNALEFHPVFSSQFFKTA